MQGLISSFKNPAIVFPTIRLRISPTPTGIGRIPGFLSVPHMLLFLSKGDDESARGIAFQKRWMVSDL